MDVGQNSGLEHVLVIALVTLFGSGSWISVSGIWTELPILIAGGLPEQHRITSIVNTLIQCSIVGMFAFLLCNKVLGSTRVYRPEIPVNYLVTFSGTIGTFLLIFFWDSWVNWSGKPHSLAFLILLLSVAMVDITSNVTFFAFMTLLKPNFMNWFLFGEGLSHIIPGFIVLIQRAGGKSKGSCVENYTFVNETQVGNTSVTYNCTAWQNVPPHFLFDPKVYFGCLFLVMLACHVSFVCLNNLPSARREYAPQADGHHLRRDGCGGLFAGQESISSSSHDGEEGDQIQLLPSKGRETNELDTDNKETDITNRNNLPEQELTTKQVIFLYSAYFLIASFGYGVMSPLVGFFGSAYGSNTFQTIVPLQQFSTAFAYFAFLVKPIYSFTAVGVSLGVAFLGFIYMLIVASTSPYPPFHDLLIGKILLVLICVTMAGSARYCHAANVWIQRNSVRSRRHLIISGAIGQVGVSIASATMFVLINVYSVFEAKQDSGKCPHDVTCEMI